MKKEKRPAEHRANDDFNLEFRGSRTKNGPLEWMYEGADLLDRIEAWAKKWPRDVAILGIDDSHFCSSSLVLVLHRKRDRVWGVTCYVITQCDDQEPVEFFMYPGHADWLRRALEVVCGFKAWDAIGKVIRSNRRRQKAKYFGTIV